MSIDNIATEHQSGRRISRPKINWLINEVYKQKDMNSSIAVGCIMSILSIVDEYEDTEEIIEEIEKVHNQILKGAKKYEQESTQKQ